MLRGTVDRVRFRGASLEGNALGDPVERELIVYLPPSYRASPPDQQAERRFPVVVLLAGFAGTGASLLNFKPWEPNLFERYERLLAQGCGEAILVLPDCFTRLGGSQYLDSPAVGDYQRYLCDDVLALVDTHYRTLPRREARAVIGKSSGGFGALRIGQDRPERFAVIGSHAGDCAFELCIRPRFVEVAPVYERHGGLDGFLRTLAEHGGAPRSQTEFHALEIAALAHAYAPLPEGGGELPFDPRTAMPIPHKWARWLAHDPLVRLGVGTGMPAETTREARPDDPAADAANHSEPQHSLRDARLVYLDAGKADEYGLQFGARMLASRLRELGAHVDHDEFEGGHMGTAYRYDVSLPKIIAALERELTSTSSMPRSESISPCANGARATRRPL
jgi:enterochelin esterase family protein